MSKQFGDRLLRAREAAGYTQQQLARRCECTPQAISNYERNLAEPTFERLSRIADVLNVPVQLLLPTQEIYIPCQGQEPVFKHVGDAGADVRAGEDKVIEPGKFASVATGMRVAIPSGHVGLLFARSGNGLKGIGITHGVGVIDAGYRGEVSVCLYNMGDEPMAIEEGDRIAQLVVVALPSVYYTELTPAGFEQLADTDRGAYGFGSTGKE